MEDNFVIGQHASDSSNEEDDELEDVNLERTTVERLSQHLGLDILPNQFAKLPEDTEIPSECVQVEPLTPEQVRWFYLVRKKTYRAMLGYDSLQLETAWRSYHDQNIPASDMPRVSIRGGMYEADVIQQRCFPVYWSRVNLKSVLEVEEYIVRGSWFYNDNWHPLKQEIADAIEKEHLKIWQVLKETKSSPTAKSQHTLYLDNYHIDWVTVNDVFSYKEAHAHRAIRNIGQKLGVSKVKHGRRLRRGYKICSLSADRYSPLSFLVFVIHGVGAKCDRYKIVRHTAEFRSCFERIKPKNFTARVEFIPIEWRSKLTLNCDRIATVTLKQSPGLRKFINNTALDILYYASPLHRDSIVTALKLELNKTYKSFLEKNPLFQGKICVIAHSLGSVLLHDILMETAAKQSSCTSEPDEVGEMLNFNINILFVIGSPLGLFLCLGDFSPPFSGSENEKYLVHPSICPRIFNIFHPSDPIAYRLEPILYPQYAEVAPLTITSFFAVVRGHDKVHSVSSNDPPLDAEPKTSGVGGKAEPEPESTRTVPGSPSKFRNVAGSAARFLYPEKWKKLQKHLSDDIGLKEVREAPKKAASDTSVTSISSQNAQLFSVRQLKRRIDYQLPIGFTESKLGYAPFVAHTSYWSNQDLAMFIMSQLIAENKQTSK